MAGSGRPLEPGAVGTGAFGAGEGAGGPPLLKMAGIGKSFPGVRALAEVTFEVRAGEVHALLGENGAGKSTLLKILAGAEAPDAGAIEIAGEPVTFAGPQAAQDAGVVTIYQELNLVPSLSIAENVLIGRAPTRLGLIDWPAMARRARALTAEVGLDADPRRLVADLSVAEQQLVEIARALAIDARLVVMDEPTSALSEREVQRLFTIIRGLTARGIAVVFVTHRLEEVKAIADRVTVLRDGRLIKVAAVAEVGIDDIIRLMVGREVERLFAHRGRAAASDVALEVRGLTRGRDPRNPSAAPIRGVSFEVRRGEILGLAGLVGAGRTDVARAIFGADPVDSGRVAVAGREMPLGSPIAAIEAGIGLVPEDRKQQACFLGLAVRLNLTVAALPTLTGALGFVDGAGEGRLVADFKRRLGIRMASPEQPIGDLSGGNQQKVILARWLALRPKVLIVDEPTRGIDVAAKVEVHHLLYELADQGIAVVAISSELSELMTIADRILTMCEGRITGEVAGREASEERLMQLMTLGAARAA